MQPNSLAKQLLFHEVNQDRWKDLVRLFGSPGGPKYCWCMVWRATPEEAKRTDGQSRRIALEGRVRDGIPIGILGYLGDEPVAWCSIAPRETYRRLGGVTDPSDEAGRVWSLVCFFVTQRLRGQGIMRLLLQAAIALARNRGAQVLEAYPVAPDSHSYRFMGFVPAFEAAGFREVGRAGTRRHVMRLSLEGKRPDDPRPSFPTPSR